MFNDYQFTGRRRRSDELTPRHDTIDQEGPTLLQHLAPSQTLNGMRGRWLGNNNAPKRPPLVEAREGRGGRPPVFTPDARPMQENTSRAAQAHRMGYMGPDGLSRLSQHNFFNVSTNRRRRGRRP